MNNSKSPALALLLFFLVNFSGYSQDTSNSPTGTVSGKVVDSVRQTPIEYANIVLYNAQDSTQATGTATNDQGSFQITRIRPGSYYLGLYFMGYKPKLTAAFKVATPNLDNDLEVIALEPTILSMEDVVVEAEKAAISYQIDKKVINVSQQQTVISGTAADVLENVPSVTVDIEGNVSLRGSGSLTVLIDGRPTILEPSEALQQIPAGSIDNIEIITNPSAKYNPEGAVGIINVIMKRNRQLGGSALVNLNAGYNDKYGGEVLLEYKTTPYRATLGFDRSKEIYTGADRETSQTFYEGLTSQINSVGDSRRARQSLNLRGELELSLTPRDMLSLGGRYRDRDRTNGANSDFSEQVLPGGLPVRYTSVAARQRTGDSYQFNLFYRHRFKPDGHELTGQINFEQGDGNEVTVNELLNEQLQRSSGQRSTEAGPDKELQARLEYVLKLNESHKVEAGYQSEIDHATENTTLHEYDPARGDYVLQPDYSNATRYQRDEYALYGIYAGRWHGFGLQGGLRGEYTDRAIGFQQQRFTVDRWDYFPTLHASYEFAAGRQMMASYTRRIERPRGWQLEPFETRTDAYNVRIGNPALQPEFIDSYEAGFQNLFGKTMLSTEVYYRVSHDKIEGVRSVHDDNVTLHSVENVGTDYSLGSELLLDFEPLRNWGVNLMGNLYDYRIEGTLGGERFARQSFNWSARFNNMIRFGKATQLQVNSRYNSPSVSSQGRRAGSFSTDVAVRQELLRKVLSATLQIRNLLGTNRNESITRGVDFYSYRYSSRESPVIMVNIRYSYNQQKNERQREMRDGGGGGGEEEF